MFAMNQKDEIQKLISEHSHLFWWVPEEKKKSLSLDAIVEAILNYGDLESVKKLFEAIGEEKASEIFYKNTKNRRRINYFPEVVNYFNLYFETVAPSGDEQ
jgi:hypothetical protein